VEQPGPGLQGDDAVHRPRRDRGDRLHPGGPAAHPGPVRQARDRPPHEPAAAPTYLPLRGEHGRRHPGHLRRVDHGVPADDRPADPPRPADFANFFSPNGPLHRSARSFIVLFTYFYTAVTFNPVDQADNLQEVRRLHPRRASGRPTAEYLDRILAAADVPGRALPGRGRALPTILINQTPRTSTSAAPRS
jgi:hypothetical protein